MITPRPRARAPGTTAATAPTKERAGVVLIERIALRRLPGSGRREGKQAATAVLIDAAGAVDKLDLYQRQLPGVGHFQCAHPDILGPNSPGIRWCNPAVGAHTQDSAGDH